MQQVLDVRAFRHENPLSRVLDVIMAQKRLLGIKVLRIKASEILFRLVIVRFPQSLSPGGRFSPKPAAPYLSTTFLSEHQIIGG